MTNNDYDTYLAVGGNSLGSIGDGAQMTEYPAPRGVYSTTGTICFVTAPDGRRYLGSMPHHLVEDRNGFYDQMMQRCEGCEPITEGIMRGEEFRKRLR